MDTDLKSRLDAGVPVVGSLAFLPSADLVEIMALAGFDFVIIDQEHSPKNWETVTHMIRAASLRGATPLVRVRENAEKDILGALESGAGGIVVPFVNDPADVRRAVDAMRYPPEGRRGSCSVTRAAEYGRLRPVFLEHCRQVNRRLPLFALIEDAAAVRNIDAIVSADTRPDVLMIGRSDLASSLGRPGQVEDPEVLAATQRVIEAARNATPAIPVCMVVYGADEAARWLGDDCRVLCYPSDSALFMGAAQAAVAAIRQGAGA